MRDQHFQFAILGMMLGACQSTGTIEHDGDNPPQSPESSMRTAHFEGPDATPLDLLWVVDNSCSMYSKQKRMADAVPRMFRELLAVPFDVHVGAISTDMVDDTQQGLLWQTEAGRYVRNDSPNPTQSLRALLDMGVSGHMEEKGRWAVYSAIEELGDDENHGFYRDEADFAVITLSDEDDASGLANYGLPALPLSSFLDWFSTLKTGDAQVSYSTIVTPVGGCSTGIAPGIEYLAATDAVGGVAHSICSPDYSGVLHDIVEHLRPDVATFALTEQVEPSSVTVRVDGTAVDVFELNDDGDVSIVVIDRATMPIDTSNHVVVTYRPLDAAL